MGHVLQGLLFNLYFALSFNIFKCAQFKTGLIKGSAYPPQDIYGP